MIGKRKKNGADERADRIGRALFRSAADNEPEAQAAASSPFIYTRILARIRAERARREGADRWFAVRGVGSRAVPAMVLIALITFGLFWSISPESQQFAPSSDDVLVEVPSGPIDYLVFTEQDSFSSDDILATLLNEEQEAAQ